MKLLRIPFVPVVLGLGLSVSALLSGCAFDSGGASSRPGAALQGTVHGGQQPVTGAAIQLYAVGSTTDGGVAQPLLTAPVSSDASGSFSITADYTCPSASALVYLAATGGNPGLGGSGQSANPQLALLSLLGPCGSLTSSTYITINEVSTVAAVYSAIPYITAVGSTGSTPTEGPLLANAFSLASELANTASGTSPGASVPSGVTIPVSQINTIANILSACINSAGGVAGDGSLCGSFFALTAPPGGPAPTDSVAALIDLANQPSQNTSALFNMIPPSPPFQPSDSQAPIDLSVHLSIPIPVISQLNPPTVTAGSGPFSLDIRGASFNTGSAVFWNQTSLSTQFISANELTATVPSGLTAPSGTAQVVVLTPGAGQSAAAALAVTAPTPTLIGISPQAISPSSAPTIVLTGTGFVANSVAQWNGGARPTIFVGPTSLQMMLSASDTATGTSGQISVFNPGPGGGTSSAISLPITTFPIPTITGLSLSVVPGYGGCSSIQVSITGTNYFSGYTRIAVNGVVLQSTLNGSTLTALLPAGTSYSAAGTVFEAVTNLGTPVYSNTFMLSTNSTPLIALCASPYNPTIYPNSNFLLSFSSTQWNVTGPVTVNALTPPTGITTANPLPFTVSSNTGTSVLFTAGSLAAGTYTIPFAGGAGTATSSATASVVASTSTPPSFGFTSGITNQIAVPIGGSASISLSTYGAYGSDFSILLSASGLPTGVTASISPSSVIPGGSFNVTLTAASNAPVSQNVPITITATPQTATPIAATTTIVASVTAPPGSLPNNRSDFVSTAATPYAIAYNRAQDYIYVSNPTWNRIDIVSNTAHKLLQSIPLRGPAALDLSQDGSTLWIGTDSQQVYAMNTQTFALTRYLLPGYPYFTTPSAWQDSALFALGDGTLLLSATPAAGSGINYNFIWTPGASTITALTSTTTFQMRSGDGSKAYANYQTSTGCQLSVYSIASRSVSVINSYTGPCFYAVNQDGSVLVGSNGSNQALYNGSNQLIGNLPVSLSSAGISFTGGSVFSPDGKTLYQIGAGSTGGALINTIDVASRTLTGTAPALSTIPNGVSQTPDLTDVVAVDNTGMIIGIQNFGIGFDDSTFFQQFDSYFSTESNPVSFLPSVGPLAGGTSSSPYGGFVMTPDVWYGPNRGTASLASNSATVVSPPGDAPGPVNLKYLYPNGGQVFTPNVFTYGPYAQYATLAGASPSGGSPGQIAGYGMPADGTGGSMTIGGSPAPITTQITQYLPFTGEPFPSTFLNFTIPPGTPGRADLTLTTPNGSTTLPKAIFYAKSVTDYSSSDTFTDVLYDSGRNQVYLSAGNHIDVFSLTSNQFLTPLTPAANGVSSSFRGLSLSQDGTQLLVANMTDGSLGVINPDTPSQTFAVAIQAPTGTGTCATGPFSVAGILNHQALVATGLPPLIGGCPKPNSIYLVNLQSRSATVPPNGCGGGQIEATSDGSLAMITDGPCLYSATTGTYLSGPNAAISYYGTTIAKDGNIAAAGNTFSDPSGNDIGQVGRPTVYYVTTGVYSQNNYPTGVLYRPRLNASGSLYYWAFPNYFDIMDGPTGTLRLRFSLAETIQNVETPMAIDDAGQKVFLITNQGLTVVDLGIAPLAIGHLTPATGASGAQIQVRGSGFVSGCTATVGGQNASVVFIDQNTLTLTLPALSSGPQNLTITNPDGTTYTLYSGLVYP